MQIVETANEGLKRAYTVKIPAKDISARIEGEVKKIAPQLRMPGFRPGKVPANLVKKMHGPQLHQEALNTTIKEAMDKLVADNKLRPAMQPDVSLGDGYEEGKDAELTVSLEVLPQIETPSVDGLKLEKLVVPVSDAEVDAEVARFAGQQKSFTDAKKGKKAESGDQVVVDFLGKLDGVEFDGGKAENQPIELGAGRLIPGFEEQLVGLKVGDETVINVTFPADYGAKELAGKDATFDIKVHAVKIAGEQEINDDLAKNLGLESLEQLKGLLRGQLEQQTAGLTRTAMKRSLLDQLAAGHDFEVPPSMVEAEFQQIWAQLTHEAGHEEDPEAALKEIEAEKDDYKAIAERRVRLGLLLSEIGQTNGVEVSQQEMQMLLAQAAQQYRPEDRQRFYEYVQQDPLAAAQLRAPLYEDKVVDFLFDKAEVAEREVTKEELQAAIEAEEGGHVHGPGCGHDHGDEKPAAKKKAAPKKKAEAAAEEAPAAEEAKPAKKTPAKKAAAPKAEAAAEEAPAKKAPAKKPAAKKAAAKD
ncbi:trigger factor [Novosphingobium sp. JCM 18896]|uniref:trigger factor n=1 Tax=Novosphingobium sp. JCM 18896 TaxID=2989731 RepID=UPI0022230D1C|nr:trigger factor [Novosphingobium sp. JCM 18896]MCW1427688.1 trigger factor [Novosphingobium sp. JCM 18896]